MKKINNIRKIALAVLFTLGICITGYSADKTNIIVILIDDMGYMDSETYGSEYYKTPNLTRLANEGMLFTNGYAASPLCSPTRASIMSGQLPGRLRMTLAITTKDNDVAEPQATQPEPSWHCGDVQNRHHLPLDIYTLGEAMQDSGYHTAHIGKWHLYQSGLGSEYEAGSRGFDFVIGGNHAPGPPDYYSPYNNNIPNLPPGPDGEYLNERLAQEAINWITTVKDSENPFFLNFWHYAVHGPVIPKLDLLQKYIDSRDPDADQRCPEMATMLESMDTSIGMLLDWLDEPENAELKANTVIILTSDNGGNTHSVTENGDNWTSNRPLRGGKGNTYEGGVKVPWIVRWNDTVSAGSVCQTAVQTTDIYPTVLDIAGVPPKPGHILDGRSILPLFKGETMDEVPIFTDFPHRFGAMCAPSVTVRLGDWKLLRFYWAGDGAETHYYELFNVARDPMEAINLREYYPDKVLELDSLIEQHLTDVDALVPIANPDYTGPSPFERGNYVINAELEQDTIYFKESGSDTLQLIDETGQKRKSFGLVIEGENWINVENTKDGKVVVSWDAVKKNGTGKVLFGWTGGATAREINGWTMEPLVLEFERTSRPGAMIMDGGFEETFSSYWSEHHIGTTDANISYSSLVDSVKVTLDSDATAWYSHGFYSKQKNNLEFGDTVHLSFYAKASVEGAQVYTTMSCDTQTIGGILLDSMVAGTLVDLSTQWQRYDTQIFIGGDSVHVATRNNYQFRFFFQDAATYVLDDLDVYLNEKAYSIKTSLIDNGSFTYINNSTWEEKLAGGTAAFSRTPLKEQEIVVSDASDMWYGVQLQNKRLTNLGDMAKSVNVSFSARSTVDDAVILPVMNSEAYDAYSQTSVLGDTIKVGQTWQSVEMQILLETGKTENRENWRFIMAFRTDATYTIDSLEVYIMEGEDLTVSALGSGITIPAGGTHFYSKGSIIELAATPTGEAAFLSWVVDGEEVEGNPIEITMDKSTSAYAVFSDGNMLRFAMASALNFTDDSYPDKANDGITDNWTGWVHKVAAAGDPSWIEFTWNHPQIFNRVLVYANSNQTYNINDYTIQYWDGSAFLDIVTIEDNTEAVRTSTFPAVTASRLRLYCTDAGAQALFYRIDEVEVYYDTKELAMEEVIGNGTVTPDVGIHIVARYDSIQLIASPETDWGFSKWVIDGSDVIQNPVTVNANDIFSITAHFSIILDRTALQAALDNAKEMVDSATIGNGAGEYSQAVFEIAINAIIDVQNVLDTATIQPVLDAALDTFNAEMAKFVPNITGIHNPNITGLRIYPNPVSDVLYIDAGEPVRYKITDTSGRVLIDQVTEQNRIDAGPLQDGIYFIQLVLKNHSVVTKRFLKWSQ